MKLKNLFLSLGLLLAWVAAGAQNVHKLGPNYYSAGLPSAKIAQYATKGKQKQENWCWAACIQTVLNYHGLGVTQEQVVERSVGDLVDVPGGPREMMRSLNGVIYSPDNGYTRVSSTFGGTSAKEIRNYLANDNPLIVGLSVPGRRVGHAYILSAIYYKQDSRGEVIPEKVVLRDPWPYSPSRQEMSWREFAQRVNSVYKVQVKQVGKKTAIN